MSRKLDAGDFSLARDRAMKQFTPAGSRQQQAWFSDWKQAVGRMQYLEIQHAELSDSLRNLLVFRGMLKRPNLNIELIKPDVETLWRETAGQAEEAAHAFYNREGGFECSFFAVSQGTYITGSITVLRKP